MSDEVIVFVTCAASDSKALAKQLVEEQLAACVNVIPQLTSIYRWEGKIVTDSEELLMIKTKRGFFEELQSRIKKLHSYEVPEIICVSIEAGYKPYLDWLKSSLRA